MPPDRTRKPPPEFELKNPVGACARRPAAIPRASTSTVWRGGQAQRHAEPPSSPGGEREGAVVRFGDAPHDGQTETDACLLGADASGAATERLDERGHPLRGELLAGVLDGENHTLGGPAGRHPYGAALGEVVDDRVVH